MKKKRFFYFLLFIAAVVVFISCKKSPVTDNTRSFTWTCRDTTYTAGWDSAFIRSMATTPIIFAGKGQGSFFSNKQLAISIASFSTGTYSIGSGNEVEYIDNTGNVFFGISGTVNITTYANNRISGSFAADVAGPTGSFPISGNFTNTPVAP